MIAAGDLRNKRNDFLGIMNNQLSGEWKWSENTRSHRFVMIMISLVAFLSLNFPHTILFVCRDVDVMSSPQLNFLVELKMGKKVENKEQSTQNVYTANLIWWNGQFRNIFIYRCCSICQFNMCERCHSWREFNERNYKKHVEFSRSSFAVGYCTANFYVCFMPTRMRD